MTVTLRDVAERAGVSRSAVSRTFTEGASVSDRTRAKVLAAAKALGYSPNVLARSLTTRRTRMIGLVANNFRNPMFLEVFDLFTRALQDRGLRPLLVNLTDQTDPQDSLRLLRQYSVDGVIVASSTLPPGFALAFHAAGVPVVHAFGRASSEPPMPVVGVDNAECGRLAGRTLLARGYGRVGFLGGPAGATSTQDRLAGFREALCASGTLAQVTFAAAYSFDAGRRTMERLIAEGACEAYFCGDDVLSIGAMSALRDAGLSVPGDVGLLGMNDMEMAGWPNIALTTIRQPIARIVGAAVERIEAQLDTPDAPADAQVFACEVVERATLRPLPSP